MHIPRLDNVTICPLSLRIGSSREGLPDVRRPARVVELIHNADSLHPPPYSYFRIDRRLRGTYTSAELRRLHIVRLIRFSSLCFLNNTRSPSLSTRLCSQPNQRLEHFISRYTVNSRSRRTLPSSEEKVFLSSTRIHILRGPDTEATRRTLKAISNGPSRWRHERRIRGARRARHPLAWSCECDAGALPN